MKRVGVWLAAIAFVIAPNVARADEPPMGAPSGERLDLPKLPSCTNCGWSLSAGGAYRSLFGEVPLTAAVMSAGAGVDASSVAWYARADYEAGRTEHGLLVRTVRGGGSIEALIGRLRLGGGADLSWVSIHRATDSTWLTRASIGLFALASVDLVRLGKHALYLGARADMEAWASVLGGSVALGFRL